MTHLRISSIIAAVIVTAVFFGTAEIYKAQIEEVSDKPDFEHPFLPFAALFLFGIPPSVAGIVASFLKTTKSKIIVFCAIIAASYVIIFIIAILMLEYPTIFGIPESYWDIEQ